MQNAPVTSAKMSEKDIDLLIYTIAGHSKKTNSNIIKIICPTPLLPHKKRQSWVLKVT